MEAQSRFALKEWAVVERALAEGRQTLLVRKGGLIDGPEGFKPEHSSFFIYPTYYHQQRLGIRNEYLHYGDDMAQSESSETVRLSVFIEVLEAFHVDRTDRLNAFSTHHILKPEEVEKRFHYGKVPGLNILHIKAHRLSASLVVPVLPHYEGCRSWVDLGRILSGGLVNPV